jgi:hypothetical protein
MTKEEKMTKAKDEISDEEIAYRIKKLRKKNPEMSRLIDDAWGYAIEKYMAEGMTLEEAEAAHYRDYKIAVGISKMEKELGRAVTREEYLRMREGWRH